MVICRYFQQGNCRFGKNCRFEHTRSDYGAVISPLLRNPHQPQPPQHVTGPFGGTKSVPGNVSQDVRDLFGVMQQELDLCERGNQWPLSCFSPMPSRCPGNVPGLDDLSPEELRCLLYEARALGNVEVCDQQIRLFYQQAAARRNSLKVLNAETFSVLETLLRTPRPSAESFSFTIGNSVAQDSWPVTNTVSQGAPSQGSLFAASPPPGGSIFGGTQQTPVFGGASQTAVPQSSIFGGTTGLQQANAFGTALPVAAPQQASLFQPTSQPTSQTPVYPGTSVFGGANQGPFGTSAQVSGFGGTTQQESIFGRSVQQQGTPFQSSATDTNIFGGASSTGGMGPSNSFSFARQFAATASSDQTSAQSPFGQGVATQNVIGLSGPQQSSQNSGNIFGGFSTSQPSQPSQNPSLLFAGSSTYHDTSLHTALADLSENDKKEFMAATFKAGCIPVQPPPNELCN